MSAVGQVALDRYPGGSGPADAMEREQRRALVAAMLVSRVPYREMVRRVEKELGKRPARGTIGRDVSVLKKRWMDRANADYETLLAEQGAMLDAMLRAWMPRALSGEAAAADTLRWVIQERSRLYGLDRMERARVKVDEQMVALEDRKVALVAQALEATLADLGLDAEQVRPILGRHLRELVA